VKLTKPNKNLLVYIERVLVRSELLRVRSKLCFGRCAACAFFVLLGELRFTSLVVELLSSVLPCWNLSFSTKAVVQRINEVVLCSVCARAVKSIVYTCSV